MNSEIPWVKTIWKYLDGPNGPMGMVHFKCTICGHIGGQGGYGAIPSEVEWVCHTCTKESLPPGLRMNLKTMRVEKEK